jgi:hypothetical protein
VIIDRFAGDRQLFWVYVGTPVVSARACRLGAEGIVSKKVDSAYQSGPCRVWIKVRNPASIAVQRERSELWNGGLPDRRPRTQLK